MAYTTGSLHLMAGAPGDLSYTYDAGSDAMATVAAAGYFNNSDDSLNLVADDKIWCQCADGNMWLRVASVSSGSVTCQFAGGNLPVQTHATGASGADMQALSVGLYDVGTSIATASRSILPEPYPGAEILVRKADTGTALFEFDAGASGTGTAPVALGLGGTGVAFDGKATPSRRITLQVEGEMFHVVASSTTRWRLTGQNISYSAVNVGASRFIAGT